MRPAGIAIEGAAVVVRGEFDPNLFTPAWLREQELVGPVEVEKQEVDFRTPDLSLFHMGWLRVHVQRDLFQVSTEAPEELLRLRDVALGVLRAISGTAVSAIGVNREFHVAVESLAAWHSIGDTITPKGIWGDLLQSPGMRATTLLAGRSDNYSGSVQVQVEPSLREKEAVYVAINDHFDLSTNGKSEVPRERPWGAAEILESSPEKLNLAIQVLLEEWEAIVDRAESIRERVVSFGRTAG